MLATPTASGNIEIAKTYNRFHFHVAGSEYSTRTYRVALLSCVVLIDLAIYVTVTLHTSDDQCMSTRVGEIMTLWTERKLITIPAEFSFKRLTASRDDENVRHHGVDVFIRFNLRRQA